MQTRNQDLTYQNDTLATVQDHPSGVAFARHVTKGRFWIPGKLPSLNELLDERGRMVRTKAANVRVVRGGSMKKTCEQKVFLRARMAEFWAPTAGFWSYLFVESTRKRDPSNISAGAIKIIEDALVQGQLAPGDGWSGVLGIATHFLHDKNNEGVLVAWDARQNYQRVDMLLMYEELKQ